MAVKISTTTPALPGYGAGSMNLGDVPPVPTGPVAPTQVVGFVPMHDCDQNECRVQSNLDCCDRNIVFGKLNLTRSGYVAEAISTYENDLNTFLQDYRIYAVNQTATATWTLQKCERNADAIQEGSEFWINSATLNNSQFGSAYPLGSITGHKTYTGYYVNWGKVLQNRGPGIYRVKLKTVYLGQITCQVSDEFWLRPFDCNLATGTFKFETYTIGKIGSHSKQGNVFDLCGINWFDSIRGPGWFGFEKTSEYLEVMNEWQSGKQELVRDEAIKKWQLEVKLWPKEYHDRLDTYMMLCPNKYISDYNINNSDYNIKQMPIVKGGLYEREYHDADHQRKLNAKAEFKAGTQSIIYSSCC